MSIERKEPRTFWLNLDTMKAYQRPAQVEGKNMVDVVEGFQVDRLTAKLKDAIELVDHLVKYGELGGADKEWAMSWTAETKQILY